MRTKHFGLTLLLFCMTPWLSMTPDLAANTPPALPDELLRDATLVFRRALDTPSAAIPASIMMRARGIAVFPAARTDGGVYYGMGVMSAKGADPLHWTLPAFVAFRGTIPFALETDTADFIFVALTPRALDYLTQNQMLPVASRIYPGALDQETREKLDADLVGYMQFGEYFAGVSLETWTIVGMNARNPPPDARAWVNAIASYFREMS